MIGASEAIELDARNDDATSDPARTDPTGNDEAIDRRARDSQVLRGVEARQESGILNHGLLHVR